MAAAMKITRYMSSYSDYPTQGEFIDYLYWKHGTVGLTVELSEQKTPPVTELPCIIQRSVKGVMVFMDSLSASDKGLLPLSNKVHFSEGIKGSGRRTNLLE